MGLHSNGSGVTGVPAEKSVEAEETSVGSAVAPANVVAVEAVGAVEDWASAEEVVGGSAPDVGSEEIPAPGFRRIGKAFAKLCAGVSRGAKPGVRSDSLARAISSEKAERVSAPANAMELEGEEGTSVLCFLDEDLRRGGLDGAAPERAENGSLRGLLSRLSRNPVPFAIGATALGGVSILVISVVLAGGRGSASTAMQKVGPGVPDVMVAEPGLMAPAAKLAMVPVQEQGGPVVKPLPEKKGRDDLRQEVLSFGEPSRRRSSTAIIGDDAKDSSALDAAAAKASSDAATSSSEIQRETVVDRSGSGPAGARDATVEVAAKVLEPEVPGPSPNAQVAGVVGAGKIAEGAREGVREVGVDREPGFVVAVARPEERDRSDGTQEQKVPKEGDERSRTERDKAERGALGLVTQLGALLAKAREELAALQIDHERLRRVADGRLGDLENRLSFLEAKSAVADARIAGSASDSATSGAAAVVPSMSDPLAVGALPKRAEETRIVKAKAVEDRSPRETVAVRRYRIQAASPHLAMLAEIERSGGAGAQIEVAIGDKIAGYGQVTQIRQRGMTWIVQTDRGTIE